MAAVGADLPLAKSVKNGKTIHKKPISEAMATKLGGSAQKDLL